MLVVKINGTSAIINGEKNICFITLYFLLILSKRKKERNTNRSKNDLDSIPNR